MLCCHVKLSKCLGRKSARMHFVATAGSGQQKGAQYRDKEEGKSEEENENQQFDIITLLWNDLEVKLFDI